MLKLDAGVRGVAVWINGHVASVQQLDRVERPSRKECHPTRVPPKMYTKYSQERSWLDEPV